MLKFSTENSSYGTFHILLLLVSIAVITILTVYLRKKKIKTWYRTLLGVGILSETLKLISYILVNEELYGGYLPKTDLPFQLCSIQLIFILILNLFNNEKVNRFLVAFMLPSCLLGGVAAILIPTNSALNMPLVSIQYFLYHAVIIAFAIHLFNCPEFQWNFKDYLGAVKFLCLFFFIAIYLNSMFYEVGSVTVNEEGVTTAINFINRVNFMYVVDPPASGLPFLNKDHGWLVYIVHFAFTAFLAVTLVYIKPVIAKIKEVVAKKKNAPTPTEEKI